MAELVLVSNDFARRDPPTAAAADRAALDHRWADAQTLMLGLGAAQAQHLDDLLNRSSDRAFLDGLAASRQTLDFVRFLAALAGDEIGFACWELRVEVDELSAEAVDAHGESADDADGRRWEGGVDG